MGLPDEFPLIKIENGLCWYKIFNGAGITSKEYSEILSK